jgi:hypothetical protein
VDKKARVLMFVYKATALLKSNSISKFSPLEEHEVIPVLRKQGGFQGVLTSRGTYPAVLKKLAAILEGTPEADTYDVVSSTFHKIAVAAA